MRNKVLFLSFFGFTFTACSSPPGAPDGASVSSFTIDELKVPNGLDWDKVKVVMDRKNPEPSVQDKTFAHSDFKTGRFEDTVFKVQYGTYQIDLKYSDTKGKIVYQSCEDEIQKRHSINQPSFTVAIRVCLASATAGGTEQEGGVVSIKPSADVSITPTLDGSTNQGGSAGQVTVAGNPFKNLSLYLNPEYAKSIRASMKLAPELAPKMEKLVNISTAIWLDKTAKIPAAEAALADARRIQTSTGKKQVVTLVVYNLPDRDCAAYASAGELKGTSGLATYKSSYIDAIAKIFKKYNDVRIVAIIEPDSLPNLATNMNLQSCQIAAPFYREGVAYAVKSLALPHTSLYLDSAHGGWLGWNDNRRKMAQIFKEVLDSAGGSEKIRGFATNVSNYSVNRINGADSNGDAFYEFNPARDELTFIRLFSQDLADAGIKNRFFVIDTSRNGQIKTRSVRGSWCNVKNAGIGERPRIEPSESVDAYLWIKPPGESDGISDSSAPRYDTMCGNQDALAKAPQAGAWFHDAFKMLVNNATPAL